MNSYKPTKINFTKEQAKKALKGKPVRLSKGQLNTGNTVILLHPTNYKLIEQSIKKGKGLTLYLAPGELNATLDSTIEGSGFFNDVWEGIKSAGKWLKDSGIGSALADAAIPAVSSVIGPAGATLARDILKKTTGVGLMPKKSKKTRSGGGLYVSKPSGNGLYL